MRVRRPGIGFKAVRAVFMAVRVNMRALAIMTMGMHRAVSVPVLVMVLVMVRSAFDPDFA
jgi:hypothetical protein